MSRLKKHNVSSVSRRFYRAAVCTELKKPMVIQQKETQPVDSCEVKVKIEAAAVNFGDLLMVEGTYQEKHEPPFTPGTEFSGIITEAGPEVKKFQVGTRVCGMAFSSSYAEEIVVTEESLVEIPDNMSYTMAAGFVVSYGTAILALERKAQIKNGESVLITAAAGAVGLAALDIAKNVYNAEVIGAVGGPDKCKLIESLGAKAVDYKKESIKTAVRGMKPNGVDVVFESVGGDVFKECFRCLGVDGRLLIIGFVSGQHPTLQATHMLVKNVSALGVYWGSYKVTNPDVFYWSIREIFRLYKVGAIHPRVDKVFKLDQVNEAFEYIRARKNMGKVVLEMS